MTMESSKDSRSKDTDSQEIDSKEINSKEISPKEISPKEIRKQKRYEAIIDAAEKVIFSRGLEDASMDMVAKEAQLGKGTLYLYFKSKNELYRAILYRAFLALRRKFLAALNPLQGEVNQEKMEKTGLDGLKVILAAYLQFYHENKDYFNAILYFQNDLFNLEDPAANEKVYLGEGIAAIELVIEQIEKGKKDGSVRSDLDAATAAYTFWGQTMGVLQLVQKKMTIVEHYHQLKAEQLISQHFEVIVSFLAK
ncbi:MAG TPA: TetR/AcrR family transcriptional regulator [Microscillaceae bacterium]|nr:TetR/AcrR family transcriptional regulator [Microscillaceae bacterium]